MRFTPCGQQGVGRGQGPRLKPVKKGSANDTAWRLEPVLLDVTDQRWEKLIWRLSFLLSRDYLSLIKSGHWQRSSSQYKMKHRAGWTKVVSFFVYLAPSQKDRLAHTRHMTNDDF